MDLVIHHVFEALVVSGAEEDLRGQLATRETVIQHLRERRQHGVGANKKPLVRITHQKTPKGQKAMCDTGSDILHFGRILLTSFPLRW